MWALVCEKMRKKRGKDGTVPESLRQVDANDRVHPNVRSVDRQGLLQVPNVRIAVIRGLRLLLSSFFDSSEEWSTWSFQSIYALDSTRNHRERHHVLLVDEEPPTAEKSPWSPRGSGALGTTLSSSIRTRETATHVQFAKDAQDMVTVVPGDEDDDAREGVKFDHLHIPQQSIVRAAPTTILTVAKSCMVSTAGRSRLRPSACITRGRKRQLDRVPLGQQDDRATNDCGGPGAEEAAERPHCHYRQKAPPNRCSPVAPRRDYRLCGHQSVIYTEDGALPRETSVQLNAGTAGRKSEKDLENSFRRHVASRDRLPLIQGGDGGKGGAPRGKRTNLFSCKKQIVSSKSLEKGFCDGASVTHLGSSFGRQAGWLELTLPTQSNQSARTAGVEV
ncbi:hypothetical protein BKA81DRAFT_379851 [Phyllosticta paracitricarpa]